MTGQRASLITPFSPSGREERARPARTRACGGDSVRVPAQARFAALAARTTELHDGLVAAATSRTGIAATVASALRWVGRGQTYSALVREITWTVVQGTRAGKADLEWLCPLIDAQLARRLDDLSRVARDAALQAETEHLRLRPHDHDGAGLLAELAAHDAAVEHVSIAYMDLLDWGVGVLQERREHAQPQRRLWPRRARKSCDRPAQCEVPQRVLDGLTVRSERLGWHDRRAA